MPVGGGKLFLGCLDCSVYKSIVRLPTSYANRYASMSEKTSRFGLAEGIARKSQYNRVDRVPDGRISKRAGASAHYVR